MFVLIAHEPDPWAPELARQVQDRTGEPAGLLTPRDLSRPGWALTTPPDGTGRLVVGGRPVVESSVGLVVSLIDEVLPEELLWIREPDTDYVASEMTASLRYWLDAMAGRVLVPPGDCSLAGPDHPTEVWAAVARLPVSHPGRAAGWLGCREVAVIDGAATGDESATLRRAAMAMAEWARLPWLRAFFAAERDELLAVTPVPALAGHVDEAARVVVGALEGRRAA